MTPVPPSATTISSLSLAQGNWEEDASAPPSPSRQRLSIISISPSLYEDSWSQLDLGDEGFEVENVDSEFGSSSSSEDRFQMQEVETRLLELIQQQNRVTEGSTDGENQGHSFESSPKAAPLHQQPHEYPCADSHNPVPSPPTNWPQSPVMLRPTPNTQMKIRGIRYANSFSYQHFPGICAGCILPINTGYESPGKSLVIDFESPLFVGSFLMRVKGARSIGSSRDASEIDSSLGYFDGKKRQFQVVVKGRFKQENISMSDCVTGQVFDRPAGQLPARFLVNTFVKFVSTLAPQLEVELDGNRPRFLSPLVATAHTVIVKEHAAVRGPPNTSDTTTPAAVANHTSEQEEDLETISYTGGLNMEDDVEEPASNDATSVMTTLPEAMKVGLGGSQRTIIQRRSARKKAFNRLAANKSEKPTFDVTKEYTFEFYQHLLLLTEPDDFKIDMGHNLQIGLARSLNGQPIKILAARKSRVPGNSCSGIAQVLWSFDLWHEALYPLAVTSHES